jgi:hypothetical protein
MRISPVMRYKTPQLVFLLALFGFPSSVLAQVRPCNLSAVDAPALRGFQLGMTVEEAKGIYNLIDASPDETGYFEVHAIPLLLPEHTAEGISGLALGFLDGRIVSIIVVYDSKTLWPSTEQLALAISKTLNLPTSWEKKTNPANPSQQVGLQLRCNGITVGVTPADVSPSKTPVLLLFKNDTKAIRDARRAKAEELRRRTFKP